MAAKRRAATFAAAIAIGAALVPAAARSQPQWDRDAVYAARVAELRQRIAARPRDPGPLADLAGFYLKPVAMRRVEAADGQVRLCPAPLRDEVIVGGSKTIYAVPWVFRGDPAAARPLLDAALQLDGRHHQSIRLMALYYRMREDVVRMQRYVLPALQHDPLDLDMARLFLDFHTVQARVLNDQAAALRTPQSHEEDRADGRYRVTTYPSGAALARASQLDEQAQAHRREAIGPLRNLVARLKGRPEHKSTHDLANAMYYHWIGELGTAGGAAGAALKADPTNLDALDYIIDLTRGTHTKGLYQQYLAIRDRWAGADTRIRSVPPPNRGPKR